MSTHPTAAAMRNGLFEIPDFRFESGESIDRLRLGYSIHGQMNARRDNVILVMPGTSHDRHGVLGHVGVDRAFDTDRFCVVCSDSIGGGASSGPADGLRGAFPRYSIRDMVHAQHRMVREGLGLGDTPLHAVAGVSMGAFQSLEWVIHHPESVRKAVLIVPAWRSGQVIRNATRRMIDFIELDARWQAGAYTEQPVQGLGAAGRHYFAWTVTDAYLEAIGEAAEDEAGIIGERFAQWDAWSIVRRYQASGAHDVSAPFGGDLQAALARVRAQVLVLPCTQDRLLGIESARQIAQGIASAELAEIDSPTGHLAYRPIPGAAASDFITQRVRAFLD